jgi:hypothetical protein
MERNDFGNYQKSTDNRGAVEFELRRLNPDMPQNQIEMYVEDLAEIPAQDVKRSFSLARQRNTRFKTPVVAQILEAYKALDFGSVPEPSKNETRGAYTNAERIHLQQVLAKYPQFRPVFDRIRPEENPNGVASEADMKEFLRLLQTVGKQ